MSARLLREAAALLRQRAEAATQGPWMDFEPDALPGQHFLAAHDGEDMAEHVASMADGNVTDAAYIATMHPGVGLAVAELLEKAHCGLDCDADGMRESFCWDCEDSTGDHECPDRRPCRHTASYQDALAVANAILGRQS